MTKRLRVKLEMKDCRICGLEKAHIFAGRYGNPRRTAAGSMVKRPFYVDAEGKRWYDGQCNDCFVKYMREYRRKTREISKGKS